MMLNFFLGFLKAFRAPDYDLNINISRFVLGMFMFYKLLSRDFGFYGTIPNPEIFFSYYPYEIYKAENYRLWFGLPILTEIFTLHWVHWVLPRPSELSLRIIQACVAASLFLFSFIGMGPKRVFAISSFLGLLYLWGYMILSAHEVDSVMLYFAMIFTFLFISYKDVPIWRLKMLLNLPANKNAGHARSAILFVFAAYYFASGYNKLTDILIIELFDSDLNGAIMSFYIKDINGYIQIPDVLYHFAKLEFRALDIFGPILVYISHLGAPIILFYRSWVVKFAIFYLLFHFIVFGVGISFLGYMLVWFVVLPWHSMLPSRIKQRSA